MGIFKNLTMGIYRHPKSGIWHANYFDAFNKRHRPSLHTRDKRVAEIKFADIRRKQSIIKDTAVNISWEDFKTKYYAFIEVEKAPDTVARHKIANRYLEELKKPRVLADISPMLLQNLKEMLIKNGKKPAGINRTLKALKTMMRQAEKWDLIPPQKWSNVSKLKEKKGRVDFYTEQEIEQILEALPQWRLIILLGVRAGLRRGEISALRWTDVDFKNNQLYIAPNKTENFRYVPISAQLLECLKAAHKQAVDAFVVKPLGSCQRGDKYFLTAAYNKTLKEKKFRGSMHTLRHTFASHLVQAGIDLYTVSKLLGHTSIKTTEIYAHLAPQTLQNAVGKLP